MLLKLQVGFKIAMATKQSSVASSGVLAAERDSKLKANERGMALEEVKCCVSNRKLLIQVTLEGGINKSTFLSRA